MAAVNLTDQRGEFGLELTVSFDVASRRNGNLQQRHRALETGFKLEHAVDRPYPVGEPFGIIQAVDTEHELGAAQAFTQPHDFGAAHRFGSARGEIIDVDADWERRELGETPLRGDGAVDHVEAKLRLQVILEILPILNGLEADQIVGQHRAGDLVVTRHGCDRAAVRPGRVQEEAERSIYAEPAQLRTENKKVIVLDPKNRLGRVEAQQGARHEGVDFAI